MLGITQEATALVDAMRSQQGLPPSYGLRLYAGATDDGQRALRVTFTDEPAADDEIVENETARVFVASEVAPTIADSVLDADMSGEQARLVLQQG
jgi:Fe-S cluster assembly iron-binding protein IscA